MLSRTSETSPESRVLGPGSLGRPLGTRDSRLGTTASSVVPERLARCASLAPVTPLSRVFEPTSQRTESNPTLPSSNAAASMAIWGLGGRTTTNRSSSRPQAAADGGKKEPLSSTTAMRPPSHASASQRSARLSFPHEAGPASSTTFGRAHSRRAEPSVRLRGHHGGRLSAPRFPRSALVPVRRRILGQPLVKLCGPQRCWTAPTAASIASACSIRLATHPRRGAVTAP